MRNCYRWNVLIIIILSLAAAQTLFAANDLMARARVLKENILLVGYEQPHLEWAASAECQGDPCSNYELWELSPGWNRDPRKRPTKVAATFRSGKREDDNRILRLNVDVLAGNDYLLVVKDRNASLQDAQDLAIAFFTTKGRARVVKTEASSVQRRRLTVRSDVALQKPSDDARLEEIRQREIKDKQGNVLVPEKKRVHHGAEFLAPGIDSEDFRSIGQIDIRLHPQDRIWSSRPTMRVEGIRNIFGETISVVSPISLGAPPKGKDDASYYFRFNYGSGRGSKPSLGADIKLKPTVGWVGPFLFRPEVLADVAKNQPSSANSIKFAALFDYTKLVGEKGYLGHRLESGGAFETDQDFDNSNLLFEFDYKPLIQGIYRTRELRTQQKASSLLNAGLIDSLDNAPEAAWGAGLEIFIGLEAGSSLRDRTVSTVEIPSYSIFRLRPRLHGFFEYKRLGVDVSSTLRFLASDEFLPGRLEDGRRFLKIVDGFKPFSVATFTIGLDSTKNISLAFAYKNGGAPPIFRTVNTGSVGIVIKY